MNIKRIIKHCNEQIEQWTVTKRSLLFLLNGGAGSSPAGGRMMRQAQAALSLHNIGDDDDDDDDDDEPKAPQKPLTDWGKRKAREALKKQTRKTYMRDYRAERLKTKQRAANSAKMKKKSGGDYGKARPLPEIDVPSDMPNLAGMAPHEAIKSALAAMRRPLGSMELTAAVVAGGFIAPASAGRVPITRYISQIAGNMAHYRNGIKKTSDGYDLR